VRSEVLGRGEFSSLDVHVNDVEGVIEVRGPIADDEVRDRLLEAVRQVAGVRDVTNLTHRPGEPAPNKAASTGAAGAPT
jgi:osmotically-inducible protein OsmY